MKGSLPLDGHFLFELTAYQKRPRQNALKDYFSILSTAL
jgi:hypothetical protein